MRQRLMPIFGARNSFSQADVQKFEPYLKAVDARDLWGMGSSYRDYGYDSGALQFYNPIGPQYFGEVDIGLHQPCFCDRCCSATQG